MNDNPTNYGWSEYPEDVKVKILEKREYEKRLGGLLEDIRQAALGIDYQTKVHLKIVEKRVYDKLIETQIEIKNIIKEVAKKSKMDSMQGTLFDE